MDILEKNYSLFSVIADFGKGAKILKEAKKLGATGGTVCLGKGTVENHLLDILGLNEVRKEILLILIEEEKESGLFHGLNEKFHFEKPHHGIVFSMDLKSCFGLRNSICPDNIANKGVREMGYDAIFAIVDKGQDSQVIKAAKGAGARGGTIIHARGSGSSNKPILFNLEIDPEKEIVLILSPNEKTNPIVQSIKEELNMDEAGNGILFVMDVKKTLGLYQE